MDRQGKIKAIYKEIADKTLSFWCKIIYEADLHFIIENDWISYIRLVDNEWCVLHLYENIIRNHWKIIWHPVILGDIIEYIDNMWYDENTYTYTNNIENIIKLWVERKKPIEEQSDDCINYIYNLIL